MAEALLVPAQDALQQSYDETPYLDQDYPLFGLDRLRGFARLFGLDTDADPTRTLRVLDLGCASGLHVRAEAARHPHVRFTGIDFAAAEIDAGCKLIAESGLTNVELVNADLRSFDVPAGEFDFVVCHGVFSWVPDDVKESILMTCRQALAPGGIAAIAYLTYPGWKQREAIRELLAMRDRRDQPTKQRIEEATRLLRFLAAGYRSRAEDPQATALLAVVEQMLKSPINAFLHDELGPIHDPCYFMQFAEWAQECGLEYLAEADLGTMSAHGLDPSAASLLDRMAPDALETQQLVDFTVNRSGRASLLVRSDATPDRAITTRDRETTQYASSWWCVTPLNAPDGTPARFECSTGRMLETAEPVMRNVLELLCARRAEAFSMTRIESALGDAGLSSDGLHDTLSGLLAHGVVEPRVPAG